MAEKWNSGHRVHTGEPGVGAYRPGVHLAQLLPLADDVPTGHGRQKSAGQIADGALDVQLEYLPASQGVQAPAPLRGAKVFAGQRAHSEAPADANVPTPHRAHAEMSTAPSAAEA